MDETLNAVNAAQEPIVEAQNPTPVVTEPAGESASAEPAIQQEEVKTEVKQTKPVQTPEENAKFAELRRKYEAEKVQIEREARDKAIADLGYVDIHGNPIKTEAEYKAAMSEKQAYERYQNAGLPEDVVSKLAKVDLLEQREQERAAAELTKQRMSKEHAEFLDYFNRLEGRAYSPDIDKIPPEVFQNAQRDGVPLKYAYADFKAAEYKAKVAEYEKGAQAAQANAKNAETSTGSVNGGGVQEAVISEEEIQNHANDVAWALKNYDKIMSFRKKKG